jgi:hypothetical protein
MPSGSRDQRLTFGLRFERAGEPRREVAGWFKAEKVLNEGPLVAPVETSAAMHKAKNRISNPHEFIK